MLDGKCETADCTDLQLQGLTSEDMSPHLNFFFFEATPIFGALSSLLLLVIGFTLLLLHCVTKSITYVMSIDKHRFELQVDWCAEAFN